MCVGNQVFVCVGNQVFHPHQREGLRNLHFPVFESLKMSIFCLECRWFESKFKQVKNFLNDGIVMQTEFFAATCPVYYGEYTFLEAYQRTGR